MSGPLLPSPPVRAVDNGLDLQNGLRPSRWAQNMKMPSSSYLAQTRFFHTLLALKMDPTKYLTTTPDRLNTCGDNLFRF